MSTLRRVRGCLLGVALGDALGMATEGMTPGVIRGTYGWVQDLHAGTGRDLPAGSVTDDTELTMVLAEAVVAAGGVVRGEVVAEHLLGWADRAGDRAAAVIGPSTARAVQRLRAGGGPGGGDGTTNGAAMRVAPVGVLHRPDDLVALVDDVEESCLVSHHTSVAVSGACLVAGAVSAAVEGRTLEGVLSAALDAAALGAGRGRPVPGPSVGERARLAARVARQARDDRDFLDAVDAEVGTSVATEESVPAAVACLVRSGGDPVRAAVLAANVGGDTDTIGAMATGIAGALAGEAALPETLVARITQVNGLDVGPLAAALAGYRR